MIIKLTYISWLDLNVLFYDFTVRMGNDFAISVFYNFRNLNCLQFLVNLHASKFYYDTYISYILAYSIYITIHQKGLFKTYSLGLLDLDTNIFEKYIFWV